METLEEFIKYFGNGEVGKFWKTITRESLIPITNIPDKKNFLKEIYNDIISGKYIPSKPRDYILINKGQNVIRLLPVFNVKDSCVYFYCTKKIEALIYGNRVPNTFGGWRLGGVIRSSEREELDRVVANLQSYEMPDGSTISLDESFEYAMPASFNPLAWRENWSEFMRALYVNSRADVYQYVAELDIANFYDNINIDTLEKKFEKLSQEKEIKDLLFNFLKNWDLGNTESGVGNKGIPQDEVADCSRLIANFFLQDFDEEMFSLCNEYGAKYFRYADDQIILAQSKETLEEIISRASVMILKYGLCFNHRKVKIMTKSMFETYFSFEWFIDRKDLKTEDTDSLNRDIRYYKGNKKTLRNRGISVMLRILSLTPAGADNISIEFLKKEILNTTFLTSPKLDVWQLTKLYGLLNADDKSVLVAGLREKSQVILQNRFHLILKKFFESIGEDIEEIDSRIGVLNELFGLKTG